MRIDVLRRYSPFLLALAVTAVVVVILFLRPNAALGLAVNVTDPVNSANGLSGFKLGEEVVITGDVNFEGGPERVVDVTLDIIQSGDVDPAFKNVIGLSLPIDEVTDLDISSQMHAVSGTAQGTLKLTVILDAVKRFQLGNGYAYGYDDGSTDSGNIRVILKYTPPSIAGDYQATIRVETEPGGQAVTPAVTNFSVLGPVEVLILTNLIESQGQGLAVLLIRWGSSEKLLRRALMNLDFGGFGSFATSQGFSPIPDASVTQEPLSSTKSMVFASKFHEALLRKWGVDPEEGLLVLPLRIPEGTLPGTYGPFDITIEDIAGQTVTIPGPRVEVAASRSALDVYLLPQFNFITPALQCFPASATQCTDDFEFDLKELLKQKVDNVSPAFATAIGKAVEDVTASDVLDIIWAYDTAQTPAFRSHVPFLSTGDLKSIGVGSGYIFKTTTDPVDPFVRIVDPDNEQFPTKAIPVPLKLTFTGRVIADPVKLPPTTDLEKVWNLVGPHAEVDTTTGVWLAPVTIPERTWVHLITFENELDIALDDSGDLILLPGGKPQIVFSQRWVSLRPPAGFPDAGPSPLPSGSTVKAGSGLWLLMCESPATTCVGGTLSFVGPAPE